MTINSKWLQTNFKQKYFLYCKNCNFSVNKVAQMKNISYTCKVIEIKEIKGEKN